MPTPCNEKKESVAKIGSGGGGYALWIAKQTSRV